MDLAGPAIQRDGDTYRGESRRRRNRQVRRSRSRAEQLAPADYAVIGVPAALLVIAHLLGGAAQPAAALWFSAALALALASLFLIDDRGRALGQVWRGNGVVSLFAAVVAVAAWTLLAPASGANTPWAAVQARGAITWDKSATLIEIVKLLSLASVFLLGCFAGSVSQRVTGGVKLILMAGAVWGVLSVLMMAAGLQPRQDERLTGGFLSANSAATVCAILLVLSVAVLITARRGLSKGRSVRRRLELAAAAFCVVLFTGCLLATASRMGLTAGVVAVSALFIWDRLSQREKLSRRTLFVATAGLVLTVLGVGGADALLARIDSLDADAANRSVIFAAHWRAFLDAPLFGHGLGSFSAVNAQLMTPENYGSLRSIRAAHNVYIQWLEEAGVLGALPMFATIGLVIATAVRRAPRLRRGGTIQRGLVATSVVVLLHGFTDYALQVPSIAALWAYLLGLQFMHGRVRRQ